MLEFTDLFLRMGVSRTVDHLVGGGGGEERGDWGNLVGVGVLDDEEMMGRDGEEMVRR